LLAFGHWLLAVGKKKKRTRLALSAAEGNNKQVAANSRIKNRN
jgi:hypothetical protein